MKFKLKTDVSKTDLKARLKRKTNPVLAEAIRLAMSLPGWKKLAIILSRGTRSYASANLSQIDALTKTGDTVIIPGKVLASGDLSRKCALLHCQFRIQQEKSLKQRSRNLLIFLMKLK